MTADPGHVVVLAAYAPSLVNFRGPLLSELVSRGWRVTAAAPDVDELTRSALEAMGVQVESTPLARTGLNPLDDIAYCRTLVQLLRRVAPDVVLAYTAKPVIWGAVASRLAGVRRMVAMITGLGYAFTAPAKPSFRAFAARIAATNLYRLAFVLADRVLFQNPDDLDLFRQQCLIAAEKAEITPGSGVDLDRFKQVQLPLETSFLMVCRFLGAKGVREYAAAALSLKARHPQVEIRLGGWIDPGPDAISREELDGWIQGGLVCLGRLDDVRPAIAAASVFVLPSYREGTPRSVLEAMAMGRPVITTDAPGCRETVRDGENGFLVAPRDSEALARAMERFVTDPSLIPAMGARSLERAQAKYDVHEVNAQVIAALSERVCGPSPRSTI